MNRQLLCVPAEQHGVVASLGEAVANLLRGFRPAGIAADGRGGFPVWSQEELATAAGVPVVTISRIETGWTEAPRPSTVRKLARALGVDPAWLLFGGESQEEKAAA